MRLTPHSAAIAENVVADSLNELQRLMDRKMDRFLAQEMHAVSLTAARTSLREIVPLQMLRHDGTVGQYADPSREAEGGTEERDECRSCVFPIAALLLTAHDGRDCSEVHTTRCCRNGYAGRSEAKQLAKEKEGCVQPHCG